jgi:CheY-like chemotaxis protein
VLIIDDEPAVRAATADLLRLEGFAVVVAADGNVALRRLRGGLRPCVILLDLGMPGNGAGFRSEQLRDRRLASIRAAAEDILESGACKCDSIDVAAICSGLKRTAEISGPRTPGIL